MPAFLESEYQPRPPDQAFFHVIPVPYEASVSYGAGTARGPEAILVASQQLEAFIGCSCPGDAGIYTAPAVDCSGPPESVLQRISAAVSAASRPGKFPVVLGGEHTVTLGAVDALAQQTLPFGIVQFDAHADLRDSYEDSRFSHACVMRRVLERGIPFFQIAVRSLSHQEDSLRHLRNIPRLDARSIAAEPLPVSILPAEFPERLYITFDIDAFDVSVMPATGTPEPGGLSWYQAVDLIDAVSTGRQLIGCDVVELAPVPHLHGCDYTAAKLAYYLMSRSLPAD